MALNTGKENEPWKLKQQLLFFRLGEPNWWCNIWNVVEPPEKGKNRIIGTKTRSTSTHAKLVQTLAVVIAAAVIIVMPIAMYTVSQWNLSYPISVQLRKGKVSTWPCIISPNGPFWRIKIYLQYSVVNYWASFWYLEETWFDRESY